MHSSRGSGHAREREDRSLLRQLTELTGQVTRRALRLATKTGGTPFRMAQALLLKPDQLRLMTPEQLEMMRDTGLYLRDLRQVAGLTIRELGAAARLKDLSLLEAVENGTATLSFELILRLAALVARHDPVPFIMRFTRTYNPELWKILEDWGIGRLPMHYERERQFVNIYRRQDAARKLSDEAFDRVLEFTRAAFDVSLHFAAQSRAMGPTRRGRQKRGRNMSP